MSDTRHLLVNMILYGLLPLWGIAGFIDWLCHRKTHVESTSGLKESLIHSLMGLQLGIPILLCLVFQVNVLIYLVCALMWIFHELVAHWNVHYASPLRKISIWEVHVHNYMATVPLYLLMLISVINWDVVIKVFTLQWSGEFALNRLAARPGSNAYLPEYLFMCLFCLLLTAEEYRDSINGFNFDQSIAIRIGKLINALRFGIRGDAAMQESLQCAPHALGRNT
jgi:hypothetical protein